MHNSNEAIIAAEKWMEKEDKRLSKSILSLSEEEKTKFRKILEDNVIKKENGCWEWTGRSQIGGYGIISYKNKNIMIHRISFMIFHGKIKRGGQICHVCDNRLCHAPYHLFLGDAQINAQDRNQKGRSPNVKNIKWEKLPYLERMKQAGLFDNQ